MALPVCAAVTAKTTAGDQPIQLSEGQMATVTGAARKVYHDWYISSDGTPMIDITFVGVTFWGAIALPK